MSKRTSTLTDGCSAVVRLLSPRVPDAFLVAGAVCFGVGIWKLNPAAVWLYAGAAFIWVAFGLAANQKPREGAQ